MQELVLNALLLFTAVLVLTANSTFASDESSAPEAPDNQYCSEDGCPGEHNTLETASESSTQSWNVFSSIIDTLITVKDTIKYNVYKAGSKTAEVYNNIVNFAEQVRVVFREEFNTFVEVIWVVTVGTYPANGIYINIVCVAIHLNFLLQIPCSGSSRMLWRIHS